MPPKKSYIKLYADECFPVTSVTYLRSLGYSIIHALDVKLITKPDTVHLKAAKKLKRALIAVDRDFLLYEDAQLEEHPGVIVLTLATVTPENVNLISKKILKYVTPEFVKGALVKASRNKLVKKKQGAIVFEKSI